MEIELKLVADQDALTSFEQTLLPKLKGKVTRSSFDVLNDYYDTPKQLLGKRKMGFRIRRVNDHIEQTIKTEGKSSNLHTITHTCTKKQKIGPQAPSGHIWSCPNLLAVV